MQDIRPTHKHDHTRMAIMADTVCGLCTISTIQHYVSHWSMHQTISSLEQWRRSVINLGGPGLRSPLSLHQSSFLPFQLVGSPRGLGRVRSPAAKHFMQ